MEIIPYREFQTKNEFLPLIDQAFPWYFTPKHHKKIIRIDQRFKNSPAGFCAVEDNRLVGFVGVMDIMTRTLDRTMELLEVYIQ